MIGRGGARPTENGTWRQIIGLLRQGSQTADDLARQLGISRSAVRVHLARLEGDHLVERSGQRTGIRRPHYLYSLTPDAEHLFCRAYMPVLQQLLDVLNDRLSPSAVTETMRDTGRRLAAGTAPQVEEPGLQGRAAQQLPERDLRERAERAMSLYEELGGAGELQEHEGRLFLEGYTCPLAAVVNAHPGVCQLVESFLGAAIATPIQTMCARGAYPRCRFEIGTPRAQRAI